MRPILLATLLLPLPTTSTPITGLFTLTAHAPTNPLFNALKLNYVGRAALFQPQARSYCGANPASLCPNGTETVWGNGLYPYALVPGGQDTYAEASGLVRILPQHSHQIPSGAFHAYEGFVCAAELPASYVPPLDGPCNETDPVYDCRKPEGLCTWRLPGGGEGEEGSGVFACEDGEGVRNGTTTTNGVSIFVRTPGFARTDCVGLEGLATHVHDSSFEVWAYV